MLLWGLEWSHNLFQRGPNLDSQSSLQSGPRGLFRHSAIKE